VTLLCLVFPVSSSPVYLRLRLAHCAMCLFAPLAWARGALGPLPHALTQLHHCSSRAPASVDEAEAVVTAPVPVAARSSKSVPCHQHELP